MAWDPGSQSRLAAVTATSAVLLLAGCTPAHTYPVATFEVAGVET